MVRWRNVENKFKVGGWWLKRHGGNHDVWTNDKKEKQIPRPPKINERLAKAILKRNGLIWARPMKGDYYD